MSKYSHNKPIRFLFVVLSIAAFSFFCTKLILAHTDTHVTPDVAERLSHPDLADRLRLVEVQQAVNTDQLKTMQELTIEKRVTRIETLIEIGLGLVIANFTTIFGLLAERLWQRVKKKDEEKE